MDLTPLSARSLQAFEMYLLAAMYWPGEEIEHAVQVAKLESGWLTASHNQQGEDSRGLWQVNVQAHPEYERLNLFDPQINAWCAYQIWIQARNWRPWLTAARKLGLL